MKHKQVLIICFSQLYRDPRVLRQIESLKADYTISTVGYSDSRHEGIENYTIKKFESNSLSEKVSSILKIVLRQFDSFYWYEHATACFQALKNKNYDVIISNDINTLPLAIKLGEATGAKVYFDAHEFHPEQHSHDLKWKLLRKAYIYYLCRTYIPKADAFSTTSKHFAQAYKKFLGQQPILINNAPDYCELDPQFLKQEDKIKIVHHGSSSPDRKIDNYIKMMDDLDDRYELYLMLVGTKKNIDALKKLAEGKSNIFFLPPVGTKEIASFINKFDIGIHLLPPLNFNHLNALPNKLLEFIQGRIASVVSPNPGMVDIVNQNEIGQVATDFTAKALAEVVNNLSIQQINLYKSKTVAIAKELNSGKNIIQIQEIVQHLSSHKKISI